MGCNPIGKGGGSISHAGPLLFLLLSLILVPFGTPARPCYKCYRKLYMERYRDFFLITHTHINSHCYDSSKLGICMHKGEKYWITENLGTSGNRLGSNCPKREKWICFTTATRGTVQDLVKEQVVSKNTKPAQQSRPIFTSHQDLYAKLKQQLKEENTPRLGKNLFVELGERIGKELNITNCWVCGGALMTEEWPWKGSNIGPVELLKWNRTNIRGGNRPEGWILSSTVIGEECLWRTGKNFLNEVGNIPCKRYKVSNKTSMWWVPEKPTWYWAQKKGKGCIYDNEIGLFQCNDTRKNPYFGIPEISKFWENINQQEGDYWKAPDGLF
ncbi:suppressyn [Corvus cornix cornix]|uniref:suppressyn n=1 Tax=Corvus cornix cornix TaxID=932674 RepID=UPI00194FC289|nr:suppressyn [Corvus cornix cornix]